MALGKFLTSKISEKRNFLRVYFMTFQRIMTAVHEEQVTKGKNPKLFLQLFPKELINLSSLIYPRLDAFSPSLSAGRMSMF